MESKSFFFTSQSSTSRSQVIYATTSLAVFLGHPLWLPVNLRRARSRNCMFVFSFAVKSTQTLPLCRAIHFISLVLVVVVMFEIRRSGRVSIHLPCPLQLISLDKNSLFLKSEFEKHSINDKTMIMKCNL